MWQRARGWSTIAVSALTTCPRIRSATAAGSAAVVAQHQLRRRRPGHHSSGVRGTRPLGPVHRDRPSRGVDRVSLVHEDGVEEFPSAAGPAIRGCGQRRVLQRPHADCGRGPCAGQSGRGRHRAPRSAAARVTNIPPCRDCGHGTGRPPAGPDTTSGGAVRSTAPDPRGLEHRGRRNAAAGPAAHPIPPTTRRDGRGCQRRPCAVSNRPIASHARGQSQPTPPLRRSFGVAMGVPVRTTTGRVRPARASCGRPAQSRRTTARIHTSGPGMVGDDQRGGCAPVSSVQRTGAALEVERRVPLGGEQVGAWRSAASGGRGPAGPLPATGNGSPGGPRARLGRPRRRTRLEQRWAAGRSNARRAAPGREGAEVVDGWTW